MMIIIIINVIITIAALAASLMHSPTEELIRRPLGPRRCEIRPRPPLVGFKSRASALNSGIR